MDKRGALAVALLIAVVTTSACGPSSARVDELEGELQSVLSQVNALESEVGRLRSQLATVERTARAAEAQAAQAISEAEDAATAVEEAGEKAQEAMDRADAACEEGEDLRRWIAALQEDTLGDVFIPLSSRYC